LRVKAPSVVSVVVVVVLAAGIMIVSAAQGEHGVDPNQDRATASEQQHAARPGTVSPVIDPPATAVVDPPATAVVDPPATAVVGPPSPYVVVAAKVAAPPALRVADWSTLPSGVPNTVIARSNGPAPVNLGTAGSFAILTKSGVTDVPGSRITGNIGASPITGAAIGLSCPEVSGRIYSVDAGGPLACRVTDAPGLTAAVRDEESAYTDAASRTNPGFVDLGAGQIGGRTLAPGLYRWSTGVSISRDMTLAGGPSDVWIFQIAGSLSQASATRVRLTGGAEARNVFWQSAGAVTLGTTSHCEGTILSQTMIAMDTGASTNGRLLAQTQVTLQQNTVTNVQ
jgi:Ice-binding-like